MELAERYIRLVKVFITNNSTITKSNLPKTNDIFNTFYNDQYQNKNLEILYKESNIQIIKLFESMVFPV